MAILTWALSDSYRAFWGESKILIKVWTDGLKSLTETNSLFILWRIYWIIWHSLDSQRPYSIDAAKRWWGGWPANAVAQTSVLYTRASWSLSLQGKTDTISKGRYSWKAPWDHTLSLTSKKVSAWIFLMGLTRMNYSHLPPMPVSGKWIHNTQMVVAKCSCS